MSITFAIEVFRPTEEFWEQVPSDLDLNVNGANAMALFERLGIEPLPWGSIDPDDLLGRAMVANVGRDDDGLPSATDGRWTDCGVRPGYFDDRMGHLAKLAVEAKHRGARVGWA